MRLVTIAASLELVQRLPNCYVCCTLLPDDLEALAREALCPDDLDLDVLGHGPAYLPRDR